MAEVQVKNQKNEVVGTLELADEVFNYEASPTLVWEAVNAYLAGRRKGTHATKGRGEVSGSGKKLWRQKGTGRARIGSVRSPLWRKGGTVHGPQPRDYSWSFPKQKRRGAMKLVLTDKLRNERLVVLEDLALTSHKTREFVQVLKNLELGRKVLVVDGRDNQSLYLGARNLPEIQMTTPEGVNVHDLVSSEVLLITRDAVLKLQEVLAR
jgi:large subunit ribosomal protein L4